MNEFFELRHYAPLMSNDQQIARFCQGLNEPLDSRLEAMRPISLQDALLRAKPLVKEIQRNSNRIRRFQSTGNRRWRTQTSGRNFTSRNSQPRPMVFAARNTNTLEFPNVRCFECNEMGHYRNKCPRLANRASTATGNTTNPGRGNANQQRGHNRGRGRGRGGRLARAQGGRGPRQAGQVHAAIGEATLEDEAGERAQLFAAIDNPRAPQQYAIVQSTTTHQGEKF